MPPAAARPLAALAAFILATAVASAVTGLSTVLARRLGILDVPGEIKIHRQATPRFGGAGLVAGTLAGLFGAAAVSGGPMAVNPAVLVGGLLMAATGAADDIFCLRPHQKLAGELAAAAVYCALAWPALRSGLSFGQLAPFAPLVGPGVIAFVVCLSNSLNLLDGLDGLAAGTTMIAAGFLAVLAHVAGNTQAIVLLGSLGGACLGFLPHNLPKARTFMGDVGSLFLGYTLAAAASGLIASPPVSLSRVLGVLVVLAVPLADTFFSVVRRLGARASVLSGDRLHLYDLFHRRLGSTWKTLAVTWGLTVLTALAGVAAFLSGAAVAYALAGAVAAGLLFLGLRTGSLVLPGKLPRSGQARPG